MDLRVDFPQPFAQTVVVSNFLSICLFFCEKYHCRQTINLTWHSQYHG